MNGFNSNLILQQISNLTDAVHWVRSEVFLALEGTYQTHRGEWHYPFTLQMPLQSAYCWEEQKNNIQSKSFHGQSRGNGHCRKEVDITCWIRIGLYSPICSSATRKHMPKWTRLSHDRFSLAGSRKARLCLMYYNSSSAVRSPKTLASSGEITKHMC